MASDIRFYADEQVPRAVSEGLRQRGIDVLTVQDAGMRGASDDEQLAFALAGRRVIITHDTDFLRLAAKARGHAGIVYAHQERPVGQIIRGLLLIFHTLSADDMAGAVEFL